MVFYTSVFTSFPTPPSHSIPNLSSPVSGEGGREGGSEERVQGGKAAPLTLSRIRSLVGGIEASNGGESIGFPGVFGCQI